MRLLAILFAGISWQGFESRTVAIMTIRNLDEKSTQRLAVDRQG